MSDYRSRFFDAVAVVVLLSTRSGRWGVFPCVRMCSGLLACTVCFKNYLQIQREWYAQASADPFS
jgi:hypothetical protein